MTQGFVFLLATRRESARIGALSILPAWAGYTIFLNNKTMSVLELIRKNSIIVLVAVFGVGVGLIMMDYADKGSMIGGNSYITVNGTGYSYPEIYSLGENGKEYIQQLSQATYGKLRDRFDANDDDRLSEDESAAMQAYAQQHPEYDNFVNVAQDTLRMWCYGINADAETNIAVNRAVLHHEAELLGIAPSKEQIDAYIQAIPAFRKADGNFDTDLYNRMVGTYKGVTNNSQEKAFRSLISDMMVWEALTAMLTDDMSFHSKATGNLIDALTQKITGKTAWLPANAVSAPSEPSEEEIKAYWEGHKDNYKSTERRIVSLYTLTPDKESSIEALMATADIIMQDLSLANGKGFDKLLAAAAENPENEAFTYQQADGSSHVTFPLSTQADAPAELQAEVNHNGQRVPLAQIAFTEVDSAPTPAEYEAASKAGNADNLAGITQVRGYFTADNGQLVFLRVEAIETPQVLPFEAARESAKADLMKERADNALDIAARKLYEEMEAAATDGVDAAFAKATAAGATVEDFGPVGIGLMADPAKLPSHMDTQALLSVPSGKLAPIVITPEGARISAVTGRTCEDSPEYTAMKAFSMIPQQNAQLKGMLLVDWLSNAYRRFEVTLPRKSEQ